LYQCYRVSGYSFFAPYETEMFGCGGFDTYLGRLNAHYFSKACLHGFDMRIQFRGLCADGYIAITQLVSGLVEHGHNAAKENF
jgi:hypothetical protein